MYRSVYEHLVASYVMVDGWSKLPVPLAANSTSSTCSPRASLRTQPSLYRILTDAPSCTTQDGPACHGHAETDTIRHSAAHDTQPWGKSGTYVMMCHFYVSKETQGQGQRKRPAVSANPVPSESSCRVNGHGCQGKSPWQSRIWRRS